MVHGRGLPVGSHLPSDCETRRFFRFSAMIMYCDLVILLLIALGGFPKRKAYQIGIDTLETMISIDVSDQERRKKPCDKVAR